MLPRSHRYGGHRTSLLGGTRWNMKVNQNNCVSVINIPEYVAKCVCGFDYNPALDLYATFSFEDDSDEILSFLLFLPGNRLAMSSSCPNHGGTIEICTFEEDKSMSDKFEIDSKDLPLDLPGTIALSPGGNILLSGEIYGDLFEIFIDWANSKVLKSREIVFPNEGTVVIEEDVTTEVLSCSQDFGVVQCNFHQPHFESDSFYELLAAKVNLHIEGEAQIQGHEKITYYVLNGEEKRISPHDCLGGLVHDGQNLIIANGDEIVLLESATEGSNAHVIASGVKPSQIRVNHEGQLMVCEKNTIKLFEYKNEVKSLQRLCRHNIRETIGTNCAERVKNLEISSLLKDYLFWKMRVIPNNCVSEIKYPKSIARADGVDYNPVLNLFVTFNYNYDGACVWDSSTGKVLARFDELGENFRDVLFLPGNHLAVSSSEAHHGGCIKICFFEDGKPASVKFVIDSEDLPVDYPGAIALSPGRNLLVSEAFNGGDLYEVLIDWDNLKVLKSREIIPSTEESVEDQILQLSCSQNFDVARFDISSDAILVAKVTEFSTEGKAQTQKQEEITYYVLDGEEKRIASNDGSHVPGLAHDGQNLIIATENEIVLLESATEGSNALLIASGVKPSGQIKINCEGQLMVCEKNAIKLFEYKNEIRLDFHWDDLSNLRLFVGKGRNEMRDHSPAVWDIKKKSSSTTLLNVHAMTGVKLIPGKTIRFSVQRRPLWSEKILLTHSKAAS
ncbi:hypothetical protein pdam_00009086 [Pocillopora damicornis]|uniref:SOCS box domain-containing protein n=1 Tax=Pocillopora damicornis TaxID=46731 RepID=A0A3M6V2T6_POCDA|nr:hypothetical protein pdam_00009086 [Pocillopora damicornis]